MTFPIAILQGRLSPSPENKFQFFPEDWISEFGIAEAMGFDGIEWLCDTPEMERGTNPILSCFSRFSIDEVQRAYVPIVSVCADWFMKYDLRSRRVKTVDTWLEDAIRFAATTQDRRVLVPLLEANAPVLMRERRVIRENLGRVVPLLKAHGVTLALETEMTRDSLCDFVDSFECPNVGIYYDIGNCTSYGFDCVADIERLAHRIKGVHVKDRKRHSTQSMLLGTGDADIRGCLEALDRIGWKGSLVLQAFRSPTTYLQDAQRQLEHMHNIRKEVFGNV